MTRNSETKEILKHWSVSTNLYFPERSGGCFRLTARHVSRAFKYPGLLGRVGHVTVNDGAMFTMNRWPINRLTLPCQRIVQ